MLLGNNNEKGGTCKLRCYWEDTVYVVTAKEDEIPVYSIKPEDSSGREKRVHRNNIMNCSAILPKECGSLENSNKKKKVVSKSKTAKIEGKKRDQRDVGSDVSDSDDESVIVVEMYDVFEKRGEEELAGENEEVEEQEEVPESVQENIDEPAEDYDDDDVPSSEPSSEEEIEPPRRASERTRKERPIFTYDTIGGNPTLINR